MWALTLLLWTAGGPALADDRFICFGQPATIVGTPGDDVLQGTEGDDVIVGLNGFDEIRGGPGSDRICGNALGDSLFGEDGDDLIDGGSGIADHIFGGPGADHILMGGGMTDEAFGEAGNDVIVAGAVKTKHGNRLFGGEGDDVLLGSDIGPHPIRASDDLDGGPGSDRLYAGSGTDILLAEDGEVDKVEGGPSARDACAVDAEDIVRGCEIFSSSDPFAEQ